MKQLTLKERISRSFNKLGVFFNKSLGNHSYDRTSEKPKREKIKKNIYDCFAFTLYPPDFIDIQERIQEHNRLQLITHSESINSKDKALIEIVKKADILFLSSGASAFDIDGFFKKVGIHNKTVIIVSALPPFEYKQWIKSRIDYHFKKIFIYNIDDFEAAMKPVLNELDGVAASSDLTDGNTVLQEQEQSNWNEKKI